MPPNPLENMLQTMMTSMFNPDQKSVVVCCRCSKAKGTQRQHSSPTSCKCSKNRGKRKSKKRSRKLETIVCVAKVAKNSGECLDCPCQGRENPTNEAEHERFCSKCGQLLPGEETKDKFSIEIESSKKLEVSRQNLNFRSAKTAVVDTGVQVDRERREPPTVRIRVCPFPNGMHNDGIRNQSRTEPGQLKTNITFDDTSDIPKGNIPHTHNEDDASPQLQAPYSARINETTKWQTDIAIMKRLALKMARAKLVERCATHNASWDTAYESRMLQKEQDLPRESNKERDEEQSEALVNTRKIIDLGEGPRTSRHGYLSLFEDVPAVGPSFDETRMSQATAIHYRRGVYNPPPDIRNESPGTVNYGQYHIPITQNNMSVGCCAGTGFYCYSPQDPSPYGDCYENACACTSSVPFVIHQPCYSYTQWQPLSDHTCYLGCNE